MPAPTLMVQGTMSSAGKSILVTGLCRLFKQRGLRVAPFKSQNMALNSFVTPDGLEIGRAQAVQAEAAGLAPAVEMNPILLKPERGRLAHLVLMGKPAGRLEPDAYDAKKNELRETIAACLAKLRAEYDLVIIEGAGSPAEINLKGRDLANMFVAKLADAPVLLVGDIDRGGVFASFVGTLELLDPDERARVAAFVVNKFRGEIELLRPGLEMLTARTHVPVLGVVPYIEDLRIADEDGVALEGRRGRPRAKADELEIAVLRVPHISNFDDVLPLEHEAGVVVRFVEAAGELEGADLVILPGSKSSVSDLAWLRQRGFAKELEERARRRQPVLGICGGCQMLGKVIEDPHGVESEALETAGLGLLPLRTRFEKEKLTAQVQARFAAPSFLSDQALPEGEIRGYEIHMGLVEREPGAQAAFEILSRSGEADRALDGAVSEGGAVVGTMLHGLFENEGLRRDLLRNLRAGKGLAPPLNTGSGVNREDEYDRLARILGEALDYEALTRIIGLH